jgi:hypothetical protein
MEDVANRGSEVIDKSYCNVVDPDTVGSGTY